MADAETIRAALHPDGPCSINGEWCSACHAANELDALVVERDLLAVALRRIVNARWNVSRANMIGIAQNALRNNGG